MYIVALCHTCYEKLGQAVTIPPPQRVFRKTYAHKEWSFYCVLRRLACSSECQRWCASLNKGFRRIRGGFELLCPVPRHAQHC